MLGFWGLFSLEQETSKAYRILMQKECSEQAPHLLVFEHCVACAGLKVVEHAQRQEAVAVVGAFGTVYLHHKQVQHCVHYSKQERAYGAQKQILHKHQT